MADSAALFLKFTFFKVRKSPLQILENLILAIFLVEN